VIIPFKLQIHKDFPNQTDMFVHCDEKRNPIKYATMYTHCTSQLRFDLYEHNKQQKKTAQGMMLLFKPVLKRFGNWLYELKK